MNRICDSNLSKYIIGCHSCGRDLERDASGLGFICPNKRNYPLCSCDSEGNDWLASIYRLIYLFVRVCVCMKARLCENSLFTFSFIDFYISIYLLFSSIAVFFLSTDIEHEPICISGVYVIRWDSYIYIVFRRIKQFNSHFSN